MISNYDDFIPRCMKITVLFINILYWSILFRAVWMQMMVTFASVIASFIQSKLLGILGIAVGMYMHIYQIVPIQQLIYVQFSPAFMLVLMETLLFITATLGFVGTLRENVCFLRWYLVVLLMLLMVHIAMGVVAFVVMFSPTTAHFQIEEMLQKALLNYKDDDQAADYINKIQTMVQCCGVGEEGYKDWNMNPYFECSFENYSAERCGVPASCCRFDTLEKIDTTCGFGITQALISQFQASKLIHTQGCAPKAEEMIQNAAELLCFTAFAIATAIICGIVLSSHMLNTLQVKVDEYWEQYNFEKNMLHYDPNYGIYHIPELETVQTCLPSSKHTCIIDNYLPFHNSYFIL